MPYLGCFLADPGNKTFYRFIEFLWHHRGRRRTWVKRDASSVSVLQDQKFFVFFLKKNLSSRLAGELMEIGVYLGKKLEVIFGILFCVSLGPRRAHSPPLWTCSSGAGRWQLGRWLDPRPAGGGGAGADLCWEGQGSPGVSTLAAFQSRTPRSRLLCAPKFVKCHNSATFLFLSSVQT